jgi:phosphoglycolate phosphatase/pyrophosphatase PpaX
MFRGVIFDLDGTIMDSFEPRISAWQEALATHGVRVPRESIAPLIGTPGIDLASRFVKEAEQVEIDEERIFSRFIPALKLFPDVEETFGLLENMNVKHVVVTSSRRKLVDSLNFRLGSAITIDDVARGKPDLEPYLKAMEKMSTTPADTLVVGDSSVDFIPSRRMSIMSVQVTHGRLVERFADVLIREIGEIPALIEGMNR